MKVYQRMIYVGLGGTGVRIGTELERQLRLGLCGPDGTLLQQTHARLDLGVNELPPYVRFVYADFDRSALSKAQSASGLDPQTWLKSSKTISQMLPNAQSSLEVGQQLRASQLSREFAWLPPEETDPQIAPLSDGAGQFPTVGRAALHGAILDANSVSAVAGPLVEALNDVAGASGAIAELTGERASDGIDVFVGFSVAGGTGCGIFYDMIHLIAQEVKVRHPSMKLKIYPLVLLPSAIGELNQAQARGIQLNGSRALLDLLRLVDVQNQGIPYEGIQVWNGSSNKFDRLQIPNATVKTAFLFSRPELMSAENVVGSVVTFVESLIGTELTERNGNEVMSFASQFVNRANTSNSPHPLGIGRRPGSATVANSLSVPLELVARALADRLLAEAIQEARHPGPGEDNTQLRNQFLGTAGLSPLATQNPRPPLQVPDTTVVGAEAIVNQYNMRSTNAQQQLAALRNRLMAEMIPPMLTFDWATGLRSLFQQAQLDPFRAARILFGDPGLNGADRVGVVGFLAERAHPGQPQVAAPVFPHTEDKWWGLRKAKFGVFEGAFTAQTQWFDREVDRYWRAAWASQSNRWEMTQERMRGGVSAIVDGFNRFAAQESTAYAEACADLYSEQRSDVLLAPEGGPDHKLDLLSDHVRNRLGKERNLNVQSPLALATALMGSDGWGGAIRHQLEHPDGKAVDWVRSRLLQAMTDILTQSDISGRALLPKLVDQLSSASLPDSLAKDADRALRPRVAGALGRLNLSQITPQGDGQLEVVVTYPAVAKDDQVELFLKQHMIFTSNAKVEFVPSQADRLVVTQTRFGQGFIDTPEVRGLVQLWAAAMQDSQPGDRLEWRQRTGYGDPFLMLSQDDLVSFWANIFNSMLMGTLKVAEGTPENPEALHILQPSDPTAHFEIRLRPRGELSGWSDAANAYERLVLSAISEAQRKPIAIFNSQKAPCFQTGNVKELHPGAMEAFVAFATARARDVALLQQRLETPLAHNLRQTYEALLQMMNPGVDRALDKQLGHGELATVRQVLTAAR